MSTPSTLKPQGNRNHVRRVSGKDSLGEDLTRGPTVIVPPKHLMAPSNAHDVAASIEIARHELEEYTFGSVSPPTPPECEVTDQFAFAFDIDGVLIRGGKPIPEAIEAMKLLNGHNEYGLKM